jgi:hypothetical protein
MNVFRILCGASALCLMASVVWANGPYQGGHGYGGYGYGGYGYGGYTDGCGSVPGCCERPISKADHIWDNYCQEKWCKQGHSCSSCSGQPYWHAAPASSCRGGCGSGCGATASDAHDGETYASPISTDSVLTNKSGSSRRATPMPVAPLPPTLREPAADQPPSPPSSKAEELQLRLQPLSRPRPARP